MQTVVHVTHEAIQKIGGIGAVLHGLLTSKVFHGPDAMRFAGVTMCAVFLVGLAALPFAPETKGQPLPE